MGFFLQDGEEVDGFGLPAFRGVEGSDSGLGVGGEGGAAVEAREGRGYLGGLVEETLPVVVAAAGEVEVVGHCL